MMFFPLLCQPPYGWLSSLRDGQGDQFAPVQAAVGGGTGHQLVAVPGPRSPAPAAARALPRAEGEDISFIDDVDALGSAETMLGCGDDNPYN
jgi:hypothetical protein